MLVEAKGVPLSVRIASGRPTARDNARKRGFVSRVVTERRPWHVRTARLK